MAKPIKRKPSGEEALREALAMIAPGTLFREAIGMIQAGTGALLCIGDTKALSDFSEGGVHGCAGDAAVDL